MHMRMRMCTLARMHARLRGGLRDLVHAALQALLLAVQLGALLRQQALVQRDELQVALGRGAVVPPHALQVPALARRARGRAARPGAGAAMRPGARRQARAAAPLRGVCDCQVRKGHVQCQAVPHVGLHIGDVHQEARRHAHQRLRAARRPWPPPGVHGSALTGKGRAGGAGARLGRPRVEPVEGGAVDERGELARADAEAVVHGAEAQHDVQVLADLRARAPAHGG